MMRVVGRMFVVAAIASIAVTSVANADPVRVRDTSTLAYVSPAEGSGPRAFMSSGFEFAEGYSLGTCSNNNGWRSFGANNATPPGPRDVTGVVATNGNPGNSLRMDQNFDFPQGTSVGCFSPKFMNPNLPTMNIDVYMNDAGGADYEVIPQSPAQGYVVARVDFSYTGNILILDDPAGAPPLDYYDTGLAWAPLEWQTLQITLDIPNGAIYYSIGPDKDNLALIYTGTIYGGTIFEEVVLRSDNYSNLVGSFDGSWPTGYADFDNIILKPEPATLALLGIGTLLVVRRRR